MSQVEFAAYLGVNDKLYNRWERQSVQPSFEWALKLSYKLNCTVNDIVEYRSENE
jgi:DNA-binding XRE family transcriptional regulator